MLLSVLLALTVIMLTARLVGAVFARMNQPAVIGEVVGGILLGPSLLGRLFPEAQAFVLPPDAAPILGVISQLGVILYMFLVGLELDLGLLRTSVSKTIGISLAAIVVPFACGTLLSLGLWESLAPRVHRSHVVRAVHRHRVVDHRVSGAGAHPQRSSECSGHRSARWR